MFTSMLRIPEYPALCYRTPVATTEGASATHWLYYTSKVHLGGLINISSLSVPSRLPLCSSALRNANFKLQFRLSLE